MRRSKRKDPAEDSRRAKRIERMRAELSALADGQEISWVSETCPPELEEAFLKQVLAFEKAPRTTLFAILTQKGVDLPAPHWLDQKTVAGKLWEIFDALASQSVFVEHTDHLSDVQLYETLWTDVLREEFVDVGDGHVWRLDMIGSGSEEEIGCYLEFYADESERGRWKDEFPECPMPERSPLPYDRDRHLPKPDDHGHPSVH